MISLINKTWNSGELTAAKCSLCFDMQGGAWQEPTTAMSTFSWTVDFSAGNTVPYTFLVDGNEIEITDPSGTIIINEAYQIRGGNNSNQLATNFFIWAQYNFPAYDYDVTLAAPQVTIIAKRPGVIYDHEIDMSGLPAYIGTTLIQVPGSDPEIVKGYSTYVYIYKDTRFFDKFPVFPVKSIQKPSGIITIGASSSLTNITKELLDPYLSSVPVITGNPIDTPIPFEDSVCDVRVSVGETVVGGIGNFQDDTPSPTPMVASKCYNGSPDLSDFDSITDLVPMVDRPSSEFIWASPYPTMIPYYFNTADNYVMDIGANSFNINHPRTESYIGYLHVNDELETGTSLIMNGESVSFSVYKDAGMGRPLSIRRLSSRKECSAEMFVFLNCKGAFEPFYGFDSYEGEINYEVSDIFRCNPCDHRSNKSVHRVSSEKSIRLYTERGKGDRGWFKYFRSFFQSPKVYKVSLEDNAYREVVVSAEQIVFRPNINRIVVPFSYSYLTTDVSLPAN